MTDTKKREELTALVDQAIRSRKDLPAALYQELRDAASAKQVVEPTLRERIRGAYQRPIVAQNPEGVTAGYALHLRVWRAEGVLPKPRWFDATAHLHHYNGSGEFRACEHQLTTPDGIGIAAIEERRTKPIDVPPQYGGN